MIDDKILVKRSAKDSVFTHLFQEPKYLLELFYALHPEEKDVTEDMIEVVTLENVLVDEIYNDLGFTVGDRLIILAEAQSTWSINIVIRLLMYLAQTLHAYFSQKVYNLYSSRKVSVPKPELYVIYTGDKKIEKDVLSFSEEFFGGEAIDVEVKVHVLTGGKEGDIIYQYVTFTKVLDEQVKVYGKTREAIERTIRICKDRDILKAYLSAHEWEVRDIMVSLFTNDEILKGFEKDLLDQGREEGRAVGLAEGLAEGEARGEAKGRAVGLAEGEARGEAKGKRENAIETARRMLLRGMQTDLVAEISGLSFSEIDALLGQGA